MFQEQLDLAEIFLQCPIVEQQVLRCPISGTWAQRPQWPLQYQDLGGVDGLTGLKEEDLLKNIGTTDFSGKCRSSLDQDKANHKLEYEPNGMYSILKNSNVANKASKWFYLMKVQWWRIQW